MGGEVNNAVTPREGSNDLSIIGGIDNDRVGGDGVIAGTGWQGAVEAFDIVPATSIGMSTRAKSPLPPVTAIRISIPSF
jgi:hypothetical protein